nr:MAG TPA: hypothetical protein [Caudoviricetes sp.]
MIYKAFSHFFKLEKYIDLHRIYTNLMSQKCRKIYNVAILSHEFTQKY